MFSAKLIRDTWLIFRRSFREGLRNPALAFIFPMVPPLIGAALFSQLFDEIVSLEQLGTDNYVSFVAAGFIMMTAMSGAGFTATGLVVDAKSGYLDRLRLLGCYRCSSSKMERSSPILTMTTAVAPMPPRCGDTSQRRRSWSTMMSPRLR